MKKPRSGLGVHADRRHALLRRIATAILAAALVVLAIGVVEAAEQAVPSKAPNIVVLLADDMGFSDLGCYGSEIATPNLDRLAENGLRFTQFYNTARCWPSRAALLTGYYAQQVRRDALPGGAGGSQGVRPPWAALLPELLKPLGYRSYHSGKWHVDGNPLECGFERSFQIEGGQNDYFKASSVIEDGKRLPDRPGFYMTTATADHAVRCLREHAEKHPGEPFFEYMAFIAPHFPLHALAEDIARYKGRYRDGWDTLRRQRWTRMNELGIVSCELSPIQRDVGPPYPFPEAMKKLGPGEVTLPRPWEELDERQREFQATKMAIHAAMLDRMDREIGRVLDQIRAMGAWENTLIVFASDNGASAEIMVRGGGHDPAASPGSEATYLCLGPGFSGAANTPLRRHKTWVHEGGISTPLVVHWPAGIAVKGELRRTPAHFVDIVPTVLDLAGGKPPAQWRGQAVPPPPGRSLVPVFAKDGEPLHAELWFCHEGHRALRMGDWKIVALNRGPWELFNLADDRGESRDLAAAEPARVQTMAARWQQLGDQFARDAGSPPISKPAAKRKPKPNLVFFLADDLRPDCLGALGHPIVKTPNIDKLLESGFVFRNAYVLGSNSGAVCLPSRTMIQTGMSYFRTARTTPTLAQTINAAGYASIRSGKFGNGPKKLDDEFHRHRDGKTAEGNADNIIGFIEEHAGKRPLFLYMASNEPHDPQFATEAFYRMYRPRDIPLPPNFLPFHPLDNGEMTVRDEKTLPWPRTRENVTGKLARYYASISYWDAQVGRVIAALKKAGQFENTIFVVAGDNGLSLGEHGLLGKQNLYEFGGMHVPLIFAGPGIEKGETNALVYLYEVYPTLCELAGIAVPPGLDAKSLAPVICRKKPKIRNCLFTAYRQCQRSIRDDRWKLIRYPLIDKTQLFDLRADPREMNDLASLPEQKERVAELTALLEKTRASYGDASPLRVDKPLPAAWSPPEDE